MRSLFLSFLLCLTFVAAAIADTVPTDYSATFSISPGYFPSGADLGTGYTNSGWSFNFTAPNLAWSSYNMTTGCYDCNSGQALVVINWHNAGLYSPGGVFTLTGPGGEIFAGTFLSGWATDSGQGVINYDEAGGGDENAHDYEKLIASVSGTWNTGSKELIHITMTGTTYSFDNSVEGNTGEATFRFVPLAATPEPESLLLLGSGAVWIAGFLRRRVY